jgi:hypothetical protein
LNWRITLKLNETFTKKPMEKNRNPKNKDQIEEYNYFVNWDWWMQLKTNKIFIKRPRPKIKNQKNKNWSWNTNNQEGQTVIFRGKERRMEKNVHR